MKKIIILIVTIILGGCAMNVNSKNITEKVPQIPMEDFFRSPEKSSFQLSPKGAYISYMKPWEEGNRTLRFIYPWILLIICICRNIYINHFRI